MGGDRTKGAEMTKKDEIMAEYIEGHDMATDIMNSWREWGDPMCKECDPEDLNIGDWITKPTEAHAGGWDAAIAGEEKDAEEWADEEIMHIVASEQYDRERPHLQGGLMGGPR